MKIFISTLHKRRNWKLYQQMILNSL